MIYDALCTYVELRLNEYIISCAGLKKNVYRYKTF